eukprot:4577781-Amphidinium_carterae.1
MECRPPPSSAQQVASLLRKGGISKVNRAGVGKSSEASSSEDEVVTFEGSLCGVREQVQSYGAGSMSCSREHLLSMREAADMGDWRIGTVEAAMLHDAVDGRQYHQQGAARWQRGKGRGRGGRHAGDFFVDAQFSERNEPGSPSGTTQEGVSHFYFSTEDVAEGSRGEDWQHVGRSASNPRCHAGMFGPQYLALNMEPWKLSFQDAVHEFAVAAYKAFQTTVPHIENAGQADHSSDCFQVPRCLHMTTWFLGRQLLGEACTALELEGSLWCVKATHLIFATQTALLAIMEVQDNTLPMESGSVPHVTLLTMPPFTPGNVRQLLQALWAQDVLHVAPVSADAERLRLVTNFHFRERALELIIFDLVGRGEAMHARLESFW